MCIAYERGVCISPVIEIVLCSVCASVCGSIARKRHLDGAQEAMCVRVVVRQRETGDEQMAVSCAALWFAVRHREGDVNSDAVSE